MQRYFQISVHALVLTAFLALALTGRLDTPSIVLFIVGAGWSFSRTARRLRPPLTARGAFVASCIYIVVFLFDTAVVSRSFIPATIHLVLFLELVKLFQEKTDRDYFYLIVLSFLKVLAASSLTIDMSFVVTLVLFLIALVSTLMSFDMFRSERKAATKTQDVTVPLGGMSVWATVWILLIGIVLFFMIPRIGTGYFSRATTPSLLMSGFTENVELGQIGQVKLSSAVVMRVRKLSGGNNVVKWRGIALDAFNGKSWYRTNRARSLMAASSRGSFTLRPMDSSGEQAAYQVVLEPLATTALFGPHRVRSVKGRFPELENDTDDGIYTRVPAPRRVQYEVFSEIPRLTSPLAMSVTRDEAIPTEIRSKYLQLPRNIDSRIATLAQQITGPAGNIQARAAAVESYLKANYKYSLELTWDPGSQPISTFLFSAKEGHCEYFASSMAILLRSTGIPTRIVNGFLMGEYNPIGDSYIVRQSDAHSWVEVYVPDRGWIEFDPTPPDPRERSNGLLAQLSHYADAAEMYWNSYILIYDSNLQFQLFRSAQDSAQNFQMDFRNRADRWASESQVFSDGVAGYMQRLFDRRSFWVFMVLAGLSLAALRYRKQIRTQLAIRRLRRGAGSISNDVVEELFYRAIQLAVDRGTVRRPAETWREWIGTLPAEKRSRMSRVLDIFERSRYGRMPVSAADFTLLEQTIRELKA
jgi:transglutaminase-like putative cysteine protease